MNIIIKRAVKEVYYKILKLNNLVKRIIFKENKGRCYVIILTPPLSGSTMLVDILSTSKSVSVNNYIGTKEGQTLPEVKRMMFNSPDRWDESKDFNWDFIKKVWLKYWDVTKPILLEKSPANILRAEAIQKAFEPCKFIISYRNPYAQCESIIRRSNDTVEYAANFAILCLKSQKRNIEKFRDTSLVMSYESITESPHEFKQKLVYLLPQLNDITLDHKIKAHNQSGTPLSITNLNKNKIKNLSQNQLDVINNVFRKNKSLLDYFKYEIIEKIN